MEVVNKQHLFLDILNMPSKTISSWNTYPTDNYRIFAIVSLENVSLIYSFKGYLTDYEKKITTSSTSDIFIKNLILNYLKIYEKMKIDFNGKKPTKENKVRLLGIIDECLTDEIVKTLDIWKYYNKTICKRNIKRRRLYLAALMFILILLSEYE